MYDLRAKARNIFVHAQDDLNFRIICRFVGTFLLDEASVRV